MKAHLQLIFIVVMTSVSSFAKTIDDAVAFMKHHGGEGATRVMTLNALFEGYVDATSIGTYDGKGTTTALLLQSPKRIGKVSNGIITVNGTEFGADGFITNTVYPANGPAITRYIGASKDLLICISFRENVSEGYSIDYYSGDELQPRRYNVRFPSSNKAEQAPQPTPAGHG